MKFIVIPLGEVLKKIASVFAVILSGLFMLKLKNISLSILLNLG